MIPAPISVNTSTSQTVISLHIHNTITNKLLCTSKNGVTQVNIFSVFADKLWHCWN